MISKEELLNLKEEILNPISESEVVPSILEIPTPKITKPWLVECADAIREVEGSTDLIVPTDFPERIKKLKGGSFGGFILPASYTHGNQSGSIPGFTTRQTINLGVLAKKITFFSGTTQRYDPSSGSVGGTRDLAIEKAEITPDSTGFIYYEVGTSGNAGWYYQIEVSISGVNMIIRTRAGYYQGSSQGVNWYGQGVRWQNPLYYVIET